MIKEWKLDNFKSIDQEKDLEFRPLTIFTGANSSGKSTILQSILLVTQTLQSPIASRSILLNGWFKKFGTYSDIVNKRDYNKNIKIGFKLSNDGYADKEEMRRRYRFGEEVRNVECEFVLSSDGDADSLQPLLDHTHLETNKSEKQESKEVLDVQKHGERSEEEQTVIEKCKENYLPTDFEYTISSKNKLRLGYYGPDIVEWKPIGVGLYHFLPSYAIGYAKYRDQMKRGFSDVLCGMKSQKLTQPMRVNEDVRRMEELDKEFMSLLWHIFMAHEMGGKEEKSFVVITKGISDIVSVEYEYEVIEDDKLVEKTKTSKVNCKSSLADFLNDQHTPFLLWKTAERKDDLDLGVRVSILQWKGESDIACIYDGYDFKIQDSFYEDYCNGHYQSKDSDIRSTIQAVTDAVTEQNLQKMHAIRTGKHGNDPQLRKNDYDAQRRDITTSIKLAYWKKGREFKIANMKEHDIVECSWE